MNKLTYNRYLQVDENVKNGHYGTYEYYTEKILTASIDEIADELNSETNIFMVISKFYKMLLILLFGNKSISYDNYRRELIDFEKEHKTKTADEISEYIISILGKYTRC